MNAHELGVVEAGPEHAGPLARLFERADCPCYCRWWHFDGDKNAWGDRCANAPGDSRDELHAALAAGAHEASGIVATSDDASVVGWMKLAPASSLAKLYDQRLYRGLPCFEGERARVFAIGCFLVDPAWRRAGVARRLVATGIDVARRRGATSIEAFPRRADILGPEEMWTGPMAALVEHGFSVVHDFRPYPVLRREIETRDPGAGGEDRLA